MDMDAVVRAIIARGAGDSALTTLLGGAHIFRAGANINVENFNKWCTVAAGPGGRTVGELPLQSRTYDVISCAKTAADAHAVARRWAELLDHQDDVPGSGILPDLVGRRLAEVVYAEASPGEIVEIEAPEKYYQIPQTFRVATYPL